MHIHKCALTYDAFFNIAAYIQSADLSSSGNLQTVLGYESSA